MEVRQPQPQRPQPQHRVEPTLRSPRVHSPPVDVRFMNLTRRSVSLVWIDFAGRHCNYGSLRSREYLDIGTFVGHVWLFLGKDTLDRMSVVIDPAKPPALHYVAEAGRSSAPPTRQWVFITLPVYSLKDLCFQALRQRKVGAQAIKQFGLPKSLTEDYYLYMVRLYKTQMVSVGRANG